MKLDISDRQMKMIMNSPKTYFESGLHGHQSAVQAIGILAESFTLEACSEKVFACSKLFSDSLFSFIPIPYYQFLFLK